MFVLQDIIWKLETARARHSGARPKGLESAAPRGAHGEIVQCLAQAGNLRFVLVGAANKPAPQKNEGK
jgi:hypothetical protein